ncbi:MAG: hypothetical protein J6P79_02305 [Pseudobutyrivibrio sp.]|nr:hypothetical protein [Pseudobutyrivibrio sp.]
MEVYLLLYPAVKDYVENVRISRDVKHVGDGWNHICVHMEGSKGMQELEYWEIACNAEGRKARKAWAKPSMRAGIGEEKHAGARAYRKCVQCRVVQSTQGLEDVENACNVEWYRARMDRDEQLLHAIHSLGKTF